MTERVRIEPGDDGRPRVLKSARPGERDRLRREHDLLERAHHPGVVAVVAWHEAADTPELELDHVGTHSLETAPPPALPQLARLAAALFATLADLHSLGVVHGGLDESHVLLDADGRPVLCSFSRATIVSDDDPDGDGPSAAGDVAAAGALLTAILAVETETDPIPLRRLGRPAPTNTWQRRLLLSLADQATHPDPSRRPSARQLSSAFGEAAAERGRPPRWRWVAPAVVGVAVVVVLALANWLQPGASADPEVVSVLDRAGGPGTTTTRAVPTTVAAGTAEPRSTTTAPPSLPSGTAAPAQPTAPPVLEHQGRRYQVGRPGDRAALGDWDCDGETTPAVVRPSTGEVFVFDAWADDDAVTVAALDTVRGATDLRPLRRDRCDALVVERDDGTPVEVEIEERT